MRLSKEDKKQLLQIARKSIEHAVHGQSLPEPEATSEALLKPCGAFVTLTQGKELRGCIGYTEAHKPLAETVREVAAKAALEDPRFPSLTKEELQQIDIEVSVLSPMKKIKDVNEIEPGKHGLMLVNGYFRGLLLPQVAAEYHWDRETFLEYTARKAGLPPEAWKDKNTTIYAFTAEIFGEKELKRVSKQE